MIRRLPVLPTVLVLLAVGVMLSLGIWQLKRMQEKHALIGRHLAAQAMSAEVPWPTDRGELEGLLYRRSRLNCAQVISLQAMAGRNAGDEAGQAHVARCRLAAGGEARVVLGWSRDLTSPAWKGGEVTGFIAPGGAEGPRLVADPPQAGLQPNAVPNPVDTPNNHLSYAVQWFLFAGTALVIYGLAVRKRLAAGAAGR